MNNNFISVAEFCEIKNITLNEFFKNYFNHLYDGFTKQENGNTYINIALIDEEIPQIVANTPTPKADKKTDDIETLKKEIERLNSIIAEKDKIITDKDNKIIEFAEKFADLTQQAFQITSQGQYIQALDKAPETTNNEILPQTIEIIPPKKQTIFNRLFKKNKVVK